MMRSRLVAVMVLASLAAGASGASAATPRASLPAIERQVMCVTCKIPLNVAQSPQADRERTLIQTLIARGLSEAQIKRALVDQYGRSVLALPSCAPSLARVTVTVAIFRASPRCSVPPM